MFLLPLNWEWRREALRTNLWLVPGLEPLGATALYAGTRVIDNAVYDGDVTLPSWMVFGAADSARGILTALAAAVITAVDVPATVGAQRTGSRPSCVQIDVRFSP